MTNMLRYDLPARWIYALLAGLLLVAAGCSNTSNGSSTGAKSALEVGDEAPAFALPSADGETVDLDDYRGERPVLMYFSMGPG